MPGCGEDQLRRRGRGDPGHCAAIAEQVRIIVADAEREVAQPADLDSTHAEAASVLEAVAGHPTR